MPRYIVDINRLPTDEETINMIDKAKNPRDRALVSALHILAARPEELRRMTTEHITSEDDKITVTLSNLKVGERGFFPRTRTFSLAKPSDFIDFLIYYVRLLPKGERLFSITVRRIEQIISELSNGAFCPYNFRHGRLTRLSRAGFTTDELLSFKGSKSLASVEPYIRAKRLEKVVRL